MTNLTQTHQELKNIFSSMPIDVLTDEMRAREIEISRQQRYISKCGDENDKNPDQSRENYKTDASDNLKVWDAMKAARDEMK